MKFAVVGEHRDFFNKNQVIEFEDLLSVEQVRLCNASIDEVLSSRLGLPLKRVAPEKAFMAGRDLWRSSERLKKIVFQRNLAEIASELLMVKPIRLGYEQLILPPSLHPIRMEENAPFLDLMESSLTLEEISSLQGILCGLMVCLTDAAPDALASSLFSLKAGNGIYFNPALPLPLADLRLRQGQRFLMIVYTGQTIVYAMQPKDPHLHYLKRFGYQSGETLSIKHHPVVFR